MILLVTYLVVEDTQTFPKSHAHFPPEGIQHGTSEVHTLWILVYFFQKYNKNRISK